MMLAILALATAISAPAPAPTAWVPTLQIGERVPGNPEFIDQQGRTVHWNDLRGSALALAFIYTQCRDTSECPAISGKFAELQRELPPGELLVEVSVDPAHDDPAALRMYAGMFGTDPKRWLLLTGNPVDVLAFARRFNVLVRPSKTRGQLEHGEALAIFDAQGTLVSLTGGNTWQPQEAAAQLRDAAGRSSNPWDRFTLWFRNFGRACGAAIGSLDTWGRTLTIAVIVGFGAFIAAVSVYLLRQLRA